MFFLHHIWICVMVKKSLVFNRGVERGGSLWRPAGANQLVSFEKPISWLSLKIDTQLNHFKKLNMPLWKSTFENEESPGKALLTSNFLTRLSQAPVAGLACGRSRPRQLG